MHYDLMQALYRFVPFPFTLPWTVFTSLRNSMSARILKKHSVETMIKVSQKSYAKVETYIKRKTLSKGKANLNTES